MSIEIYSDIKSGTEIEPSAHWLPVRIEAPNGVNQAKTDCYFCPQIQQTTDQGLTSSFRGRQLNGENIKFPDDYQCFVVDETRKPLSEDSKRKLFASSKFAKLTYWNWDQRTSENDSIRKMLDWIDIAEELHKTDVS